VSLILEAVKQLMLKLTNLKNAARLWELTDLAAVHPNETCWSGWYQMLHRYRWMESHIEQIHDPLFGFVGQGKYTDSPRKI
jgi:hypothetical protein